jgi:hypothetical protein
MFSPKLTALAATAAIGVAAIAPATGQAKATTMGKHSVTATAYVQKQAGKIFDGTMFRGETFKVERLSKSGKYAYGMAYGHVNRHAWIEAAALTKKR